MTLYGSRPATAGLGYGLGGQSTTAQSTSNHAYIPLEDYQRLPPGQREVVDRGIADGRWVYDVATERFVFYSQPFQPESSAAYDRQQHLIAAQQRMQAAQQQYMQDRQTTQAAQEYTLAQEAQRIAAAVFNSSAFSSIYQAASQPEATKKSTDSVIRSMELFYDWLSPDQRKQLATRGFITVIGGKTGINYRIYEPANYNIHELDKETGETLVKLCFQPVDRMLPKGDIWLCQKLALELDEENTLALANRSAHYQY